MNTSPILRVTALSKHFPLERGFLKKKVAYVRAVNHVSFEIQRGETLGLVGESGCGKTTLGRCVLRAIEPTSGRVVYDIDGSEIDILSLHSESLRAARRHFQMIFQDPYSSLDPRMTVYDIISEPLRVNEYAKGFNVRERVMELMDHVGLRVQHMNRYPHAFSGGQRQRIGIARALALNPRFLVADEPVSALDVSIRAQIINLLIKLQRELGLTYLFISHDLSVVRHICTRIAVMYVGEIVELAETDQLFFRPLHPYSQALLSAVPKPDPDIKGEKIILPGEAASPIAPPPGCHFHPRCLHAQAVCQVEKPKLSATEPHRLVACHLAERLSLRGIAK